MDLPSVHHHSHPKSPEDRRMPHGAMCLWSQISRSVLQLRQAPKSFWPPHVVHITSTGTPPPRPRCLTSVRHILQQPGFWLHHVPVAEEDEPPEVALVISLHVLDDVVAAQGAVVLVLNDPDPNVPTHRQEGHLKEQQSCGRNASSIEKDESLIPCLCVSVRNPHTKVLCSNNSKDSPLRQSTFLGHLTRSQKA